MREFSWRRLRKLFLFAVVPVIGIVSPLLVIPTVTSQYGATGWSAMAIGMSVGAAAAVFVELGWGLTGPQRVAGAPVSQRGHLYLLSNATKLSVFVLLSPFVYAICWFLTPSYAMECALMGVATAAVGLSPAWFFTGTSQPLRILATDSAPKLVAAGVTAVALLAGGDLVLYPVIFLILTLASPVVGSFLAGLTRSSSQGLSMRSMISTIRQQLVALTGRAASSVYLSLPTAILAAISPTSVAAFSAADRLQRMTLSALASVPNSMQGWVGSSERGAVRAGRIRLAILGNAGLGLVSGLTFAFLAPFAAELVFAGEISVSYSLSAACGLIIFFTCTSRATGGLGLIGVGRVGWLTISALVGAIVGISLILWLGAVYGAIGALVAMAIAECAVLAVQLVAIRAAGRAPDSQLRPEPRLPAS